jgi:hypothetical protein
LLPLQSKILYVAKNERFLLRRERNDPEAGSARKICHVWALLWGVKKPFEAKLVKKMSLPILFRSVHGNTYIPRPGDKPGG